MSIDLESVLEEKNNSKGHLNWPSDFYEILAIAYGENVARRKISNFDIQELPIENIICLKIDDDECYFDSYIFQLFPNLRKIILSSSIKELEDGVFAYNDMLEEIIIPASVTSIGKQIFYGSSSLKKVVIDESNPIYKIEDNCLMTKNGVFLESFGSFKLPESITKLAPNCFESCFLDTLVLPNSLIEIGDNSFNCSSIRSIFIGPNVSKISETAFANINDLEEIKVDEVNSCYKSINNSCLIDVKNKTLLLCLVEPNEEIYDCANKIGYLCFNRHNVKHLNLSNKILEISNYGLLSDYLNEIVLNEDLQSIGEYAFSTDAIKKISIPNSVKSIGRGCFSKCEWLESVRLGENMTQISDEMFCECNNIKYLDLPLKIKSIGRYSFRNSGIIAINLNSRLESIEFGAFSNTHNLEKITIPDSVKFIDSTAFDGSSIKKIIVSNNNPVYYTNTDCNKLFFKADNKLVIDLEQ